MDLQKLFQMQKTLDDRIIKEKGLEGKDLFPNTVLALQVELGEFANEGRWFKHWSNDQEPRYQTVNWEIAKDVPIRNELITNLDAEINYAVVEEVERKPLLEEFVDCLHFFLSIAIQKGCQDALYIFEEQLDPDDFDGDLTGNYLEMVYHLNTSYMQKYSKDDKIAGFQANEYWFRMGWILFLNIGINGFGFTLDQIEQAYYEKNKINHQRQNNGY